MNNETKSFGKAIEEIKSNPDKLIMFREKWHGVLLGKLMGIVSSKRTELDNVFLFIVGDENTGDENVYAWTPSQHDMFSDDWIVQDLEEIQTKFEKLSNEKQGDTTE